MSDIAIRVENLSKKYRVGESTRYKALRDVLSNFITSPFRKFKGPSKKTSFIGYIWALKDVSFEIKKGEVVGIIGRNGAGKTTLLKVLSRITYPTEGLAEIYGRVGSLLEVGTGFHPELTGRENIYLNGAILGMKKKEIDNKFDEIVAFSEIEKFIDTTVKYYSSGMYTRLAFAVAAHMEPEILLVDEVLAVGDLAFQKKCLGKMEDVSLKEDRTVLFVSHNMQAIKQVCSRAILFNEGKLLKEAATEDVLNAYLSLGADADQKDKDLRNPRLRKSYSHPDSLFKWIHIQILNSQKELASEVRFYEPFEIVVRGYATKTCSNILLGFAIFSKMGGFVFSGLQTYGGLPDNLPRGISEFHIEINPNILAPGHYQINLGATGSGIADGIDAALEFSVMNISFRPDKTWDTRFQVGSVDHPCTWSLKTNLPENNPF